MAVSWNHSQEDVGCEASCLSHLITKCWDKLLDGAPIDMIYFSLKPRMASKKVGIVPHGTVVPGTIELLACCNPDGHSFIFHFLQLFVFSFYRDNHQPNNYFTIVHPKTVDPSIAIAIGT